MITFSVGQRTVIAVVHRDFEGGDVLALAECLAPGCGATGVFRCFHGQGRHGDACQRAHGLEMMDWGREHACTQTGDGETTIYGIA